MRHTREGGYPDAKMTFYDFIKFGILNFGFCDLFGLCDLLFEIFLIAETRQLTFITKYC
jgi:hypothetical protein